MLYVLVKYTIYFVKYFINLFIESYELLRALDALLSDNINSHLICRYADLSDNLCLNKLFYNKIIFEALFQKLYSPCATNELKKI